MATRAQKAAARRNIKKAQAARRKKARSHAANPAKKRKRTHAANPAKRRRVRRRTRFTVKVGKPRGRKRQRVATVVIQPTTRRRRKKKKAASRRKAASAPAQLMPNPAKKRRRHRKGTQQIRIRRGSKIVRLFRNPSDGMYYENPIDLGGDFGDLGGLGGFGGGLDSHFAANPGFEENPGIAGAFAPANLKNFGVAAGGVAVGLFVARLADRYVATMKPKGGANPWYGANAAAVINSKPDAKRLGVQALGAAGSIAAAWSLRNRGWAAWLFGGLATGFGANALMSILDWWVGPAVLKAESGAVKLGNRLFPLEQKYVQDYVKNAFTNWSTQAHLNQGQNGDPSSPSPTGGADTYTYQLGAPRTSAAPTQLPRASAPARVGAPVLAVNRVGNCPSCGAESGGCYANCPSLCPECPKDTSATAEITISPSHASSGVLRSWANLAGVPVEHVNALNGGTPDQYWRAGHTVKLPYAMGVAYHLYEQGKGPFALAGLPVNASSETSMAPVAAPPPPVGSPAGPAAAPTAFERPAVNEALDFERRMSADFNAALGN